LRIIIKLASQDFVKNNEFWNWTLFKVKEKEGANHWVSFYFWLHKNLQSLMISFHYSRKSSRKNKALPRLKAINLITETIRKIIFENFK